MVKSLAFSMTVLLFVGTQAVAQTPTPAPTPAATPAPATPTPPVVDAAPPTKTDAAPVKVAKTDEPVCRYVAIDGSKVRKRICN